VWALPVVPPAQQMRSIWQKILIPWVSAYLRSLLCSQAIAAHVAPVGCPVPRICGRCSTNTVLRGKNKMSSANQSHLAQGWAWRYSGVVQNCSKGQ
jgi:hypothetical protein